MQPLLIELEAAIGRDKLSGSLVDRLAYAHDTFPPALKRAESPDQPFQPELIVFPHDEQDVSAVLRVASAHHTPVTVYGGGSGIVGGALARGGILMEMKRLGEVDALDEISQLVTVGAGINGQRLEDALAARGFTLGHYPQSLRSSTVGGWIAHRATGTASTRYGGIEALVAGMQVVLASGEIVNLRPTPRSATGPDLRQLFLGSEGTLGVVTRATLRIRPIPELRRWLVCTFPTLPEGLDVVRRAIQAELRPAVVRLYDEIESAHLLEAGGEAPGTCLLLLACEGRTELVNHEIHMLEHILAESGGRMISNAPAEAWWNDRFNTRGLLRTMRAPLGISDALEVSATWRDLPGLYAHMRTAMEGALGLPGRPGQVYGHCSHVYPDGGNLYMIFHGFAEDEAGIPALYERTLEAAFTACFESGGSLSHHHGIGLGKARFLTGELGPTGVETLRAVQQALDPLGILNPGKLGDTE